MTVATLTRELLRMARKRKRRINWGLLAGVAFSIAVWAIIIWAIIHGIR